MTKPVICRTFFHYQKPDDSLPVRVILSWDDRDPVAMTVVFQTGKVPSEDPTWIFARSLLADGLITETGCADVKVSPPVKGRMRIVLDSPSGHAEFTTAAGPIQRFLNETYSVIAGECEYADVDVDAALADLLDREAA